MKYIASLAVVFPLATALLLPAQAQPRHDPYRPTVNQLIARDEARIAQLKANLRLTQEQESDWNRLEATFKDISKKRAERRVALMDEWDKRDTKRLTHVEALRKHADALALRAEEIRAIADAAEPLSGKLNDYQRNRIDELIRVYVKTPFIPGDPRRGY